MSYGYFYNPVHYAGYGLSLPRPSELMSIPMTALERAGLGVEPGDYVKAGVYGVVIGGLMGMLVSGKSKKKQMNARMLGAAVGAGLSMLYVKNMEDSGSEAVIETVLV